MPCIINHISPPDISSQFYSHYRMDQFSSVTQLCPTLCNPMDYSLPDSSVHGIFQSRRLEWVVISSSRDLPDPKIEPMFPASPALAGRFFTAKPPGKHHKKAISCCKCFLVLARLQGGCLNISFPAAIHRWAWSGCSL